jgi:hypothetical protein
MPVPMRDDPLVPVRRASVTFQNLPSSDRFTVVDCETECLYSDRLAETVSEMLQAETEEEFGLRLAELEQCPDPHVVEEADDFLGRYDPDDEAIAIYRDRITELPGRLAPLGVSLSPVNVETVVTIHEEMHSLHHLSGDPRNNNRIWEEFGSIPSWVAETLAQLFTYHECKARGMEQTFLDINKFQPLVYRLWPLFRKVPRERFYWLMRDGSWRIQQVLARVGYRMKTTKPVRPITNFVDVVGYQLEKVHSGVIGWLLDSDVSPLRITERNGLLNTLSGNRGFGFTPTRSVSTREYSFGRQLRIDLVIELDGASPDEKHSIVMEFKTDSDVSLKQLEATRETFLAGNRRGNSSFWLVALGAAQFTYSHTENDIRKQGFGVMNLRDCLGMFRGLSIQGDRRAYDDWIEALEAEKSRFDNIEINLQSVDDPGDLRLRSMGYRLGFPVYYNAYAAMRRHFNQHPYDVWSIYSGRGNPVLDWDNAWTDGKNVDGAKIYFCWQFNRMDFKLKVGPFKQVEPEWWNELRNDLVKICESYHQRKGVPAVQRRGEYVSVYKWKFDFCKGNFRQIAGQIMDILDHLHPRISAL